MYWSVPTIIPSPVSGVDCVGADARCAAAVPDPMWLKDRALHGFVGVPHARCAAFRGRRQGSPGAHLRRGLDRGRPAAWYAWTDTNEDQMVNPG
jgi:hypothetical protein